MVGGYMKKCRICKQYFPLDNFYKNKASKDGLAAKCIPCDKRIRAEYRARQALDPEWKKKFNYKNTLSRRKAGKVGQMFAAARERARAKQIEFTITKDDINIPQTCPVLGINIEAGEGRVSDVNGNERKLVGAKDTSPSLDRIDNSKGYTPDNIRVISWRANYLKNNATLDELIRLGEDAKNFLPDN